MSADADSAENVLGFAKRRSWSFPFVLRTIAMFPQPRSVAPFAPGSDAMFTHVSHVLGWPVLPSPGDVNAAECVIPSASSNGPATW